jgi:hypothetical protein
VTALQTQNESDAQAMAQLITERGVR